MRTLEWTGWSVAVALWLLLAAPTQADRLPLGASSEPVFAASLGSSESAVTFNSYDFSSIDFDDLLLGHSEGRGIRAFLALFSPFRGGPGDHHPGRHPEDRDEHADHDRHRLGLGVIRWWFHHLGLLHHRVQHQPVVPEPSSGLMMLLGLGAWMLLSRRSRP
ncbi:MAG: PEP-CTERM sorting domain-containing protein [Myxococcota bacterium]|nr:PEP-CTERM sorting domain-containing protein [Myxococcota bacterium]